jgi:hypothetical protein
MGYHTFHLSRLTLKVVVVIEIMDYELNALFEDTFDNGKSQENLLL